MAAGEGAGLRRGRQGSEARKGQLRRVKRRRKKGQRKARLWETLKTEGGKKKGGERMLGSWPPGVFTAEEMR